MAQRWQNMRSRGNGARAAARRDAMAGAIGVFRENVRSQNRSVNRRSRRSGISSTSVFQAAPKKPELKFLDLESAINPVLAGTGSLQLLNGCAQGTDAIQHIGRQTTMKSIYWLWEGSIAATTTLGGPVRLVILYDKESEGAAPTIAVGGATQTDAFNQDNILAQMNLNNRDRFVSLVDEIVECIGTAGPQSFMRKGFRKIALPCVFNANTGATIAALNTGGVYAFVWGADFATAGISTTLQTRIRFEDN